MKMRSVVRLSALMLALVLTLGAGAAAGAEGTRVCGIRAESTRELYDSLIGTGEWDNQRRPSEVRVNRLIRIDPHTVRRVGAILDERIFDSVAREVLRHY